MKKRCLEYLARVIGLVIGFVLSAGMSTLAGSDNRPDGRRPDDVHYSNGMLSGDDVWAAQGSASPGPNFHPRRHSRP
jgi:hypothetical protein